MPICCFETLCGVLFLLIPNRCAENGEYSDRWNFINLID
jgi:hypothetical protein